jgi:hypothetical protein
VFGLLVEALEVADGALAPGSADCPATAPMDGEPGITAAINAVARASLVVRVMTVILLECLGD